MIIKKTLSSGCSFTPGGWEANFNQYTQHKDLAFPGAGNKYIADSIIHYTTQNDYDCVFVMWSGMTRLEIPITNTKYFDNYFNVSVKGHTPGNTRYVMSGGEYGNYLEHPMAKSMFSNIYKFTSYEDLAILSITEIIKLQGYLKSKNIPYYFMSYINYWNQPNDWLSKNCDKGLNNYPELNSIISQIDFESWIFLNDNKDGIFELALESNLLMSDNYHPNKQAQNLWFDIIQQRLNLDQHCYS